MDAPHFAEIAFEEAPIGLVLTENRQIKACNETFCAMTQFTKAELIGESFRLLYASDSEYESIRNIGMEALVSKGNYSDHRLLFRKHAPPIWCRFRARTLTPDAPLSRTVLSYARLEEKSQEKPVSPRERDVISGLTRGQTSKEIARDLGLSVRTVEDVRFRLLKKFDVKSSNELLWHFKNIEL